MIRMVCCENPGLPWRILGVNWDGSHEWLMPYALVRRCTSTTNRRTPRLKARTTYCTLIEALSVSERHKVEPTLDLVYAVVIRFALLSCRR